MVREAGLEPIHIRSKIQCFQCVFNFVSLFVSLLKAESRNSGLRGEEIGDGFYRGGDVGIGNVRVNFPHSLIVCPAADFHGDLFRYAKMIGERTEGMA